MYRSYINDKRDKINFRDKKVMVLNGEKWNGVGLKNVIGDSGNLRNIN